MNRLKEKYYIALGNLQNMAIDNTKGSKGVDICVLDINEYVAYLQSKIDKANEILDKLCIYGYNQAKCRPIKNTTKQEVYNAIYEIKKNLGEDK